MTISPVNQLVATIRSQLAAGNVLRRNAAPAKKSAVHQAGTYAAQNLDKLIAQRIGEIGRDAPNRGKKAFRVFLEAVLLSQLGEHLINDPRFYELLDEVQEAIENHPDSHALMEQACAQLLQEN